MPPVPPDPQVKEKAAPKVSVVVPSTTKPDKQSIIDSIKKNSAIPDTVRNEILQGLDGKTPTITISPDLITKPIPAPKNFVPPKTKSVAPVTPHIINPYKPDTPPTKKLPFRLVPLSDRSLPQKTVKDKITPFSFIKHKVEKGDKQVPTTMITVPDVKILGNDKEYGYGQLVRLWVEPPSKTEHLHSVSYSWVILPKADVEVWPDSTKIVFASGIEKKQYSVILTASYVFVIKSDGKDPKIVQRVLTQATQVNIGGAAVPPITPPVTPPDLKGLAASAYDWTKYVKRTSTYTDASVKVDAIKLAASFSAIAGEIDAGKLKDVGAIIKATQSRNDTTITNKDEWLPWFTRMSDYLKAEFAKGTMTSPAQYSSAWKDISKGLQAASK